MPPLRGFFGAVLVQALFCRRMTYQQLTQLISERQSYLCVGLDADVQKLPEGLPNTAAGVLQFNKDIVDATRHTCVAYKLNTAFYEAMGAAGWQVMADTLEYIGSNHFKIADAKRGDIGNTGQLYARAFFETLNADAVTVAPYMGSDSVMPFLAYAGKWAIVLALTSNPGSADFEKLLLQPEQEPSGLIPNVIKGQRSELLYERVINTVAQWGSQQNLMFVVGATQAAELSHIRSLIPNHFLLVPGVGAQGGSLHEVSLAALHNKTGLLVNASRAIIYASLGSDYAAAAKTVAETYAAEMATYLK